MSLINKNCPFCGGQLEMENYRGVSGMQCEVYCDNDDCDTKPVSISGSAQVTFADVAAWGRDTDA